MWPLSPKFNSGYVPDELDPRDIWLDEVYAGDTDPLPESYRIEGLPFRDQGLYPYCGSMACTSAAQFEYSQIGQTVEFSQPKTFYEAGGTPQGSTIRGNLDVLVKHGAIPYKDFPLPKDVNDRPEDWYQINKKTALDLPFRDAKKINGYAKVICLPDHLKRAILRYGCIIVPVAAYGAYFSPTGYAKRVNWDDNHLVVLKGWDKNGWLIHDSLSWKTNGDRWLDISYQFAVAYCLLDLPEDWREKRDEVRKATAPNALEHYGQRRSLAREIEVANELLKQLKAFNNQSVLEAAGRFWTVLTNAIAYGGYSYRDACNDVYNWRRTGQHIFDFNHETREQWAKRIKS